MRYLTRFVIAIVAALFVASVSEAAPTHSKDIIILADQWLGMSMDQFKQAAQITPGATIMKTTSASGKEDTQLADASAPGLQGLEPASLNIFRYTFDSTGHLVEISGTVGRNTDAMAAHILTSTYGPPVSGSTLLGMSANLWVFNSVAVEISAGFVFIYRFPQRCIEALKGAPPDPKALEGCGRP
jgi:hypothetical protein